MIKDLLFQYEVGQDVIVIKTGYKGKIYRRMFSMLDYGDSEMITEKYTVGSDDSSYKIELKPDEFRPAVESELVNPDKVNYVITDSQLSAYNRDGDTKHFDVIRGLQSEKEGKKEEGSY